MSIQVTNLLSGAAVTYSLPILAGEVTPPLTQGHLKVTCFREGRARLWPIYNGQFKVLVPLQSGENKIELHFFDETVDFVLYYNVPTIKKYVRPIYIKPCDDSGMFQGPEGEDTSIESAVRRIALAAKLIQSFTAEKLHEHGLGRKTFVLESDLYPESPPCQVFTSKMNLKRARETAGGDLWMSFARELMSSKIFKEKDNVKWYAFMSFTHYCPPEGVVPKSHSEVIRFTQGHTALGGGGLALFGTGNLHTWAANLDEFVSRFTDTRKIDRSKLMDDSAYRQYHWANYSTGLGASLHELGHTFDLAHTPTGIMSRGFDDIYRTFLAQPMALSRGSLSRDSSRLASPIPYSPKESPVHKPRRRESFNEQKSGGGSRSSSPKPCPLSRPPQARSGVAMMPSVIQIETAFRRVATENIQTLTVHNYDGSETKKTITRNRDGTETISEVTTYPDGKQIAREIIKHIASGKTRTTMSMSTSVDQSEKEFESKSQCSQHSGSQSNDISHPSSNSSASKQDEPSAHNTSQSTSVSDLARLPKATDDGSASSESSLSFQEVKYRDGGAHWYRSSAVMLTSHKWFNEPRENDPHKPPELQNGTVKAVGDRGLRLIELRSFPEGVVFHHWEFLQDQPPTAFTLRQSEIMQLSRNAEQITVVAEDDYGNIIKKKILVADLGKKAEQIKDLRKEFKLQDSAMTPVGKNEQRIKDVGEKDITNETENTTMAENSKEELLVRKGEMEDEVNIWPKMTKSNVSAERQDAMSTGDEIPKDSNVSNSTKVQKLKSKDEEKKESLGSIVKHQTTTSNFTEIRDKEILPLEDTIHCNKRLLNGLKEGSGKTDCNDMIRKDSEQKPKLNKDSYISELTQEYQQELEDETVDETEHSRSMTIGDENATCNQGQHASPETAGEHVQGNISNGMNGDKMCTDYLQSGTVHANGQDGEIKLAVNSSEQNSTSISSVRSSVHSTETDRDAGGMVRPVSENTMDDPPASEVSESEEDLMKNSVESNGSGKVDSLERVQTVEMNDQSDNFNRNEQHNMAVQQTMESNQGVDGMDGNEMVESFHVENGNFNV